MTNPELPNKPSRKELEKQQRRLDILMAAKTLFVQKGYHNTTLEEVAQLAEFGKGTIYNYFRNKEDLFYAILEHYTAEVLEITKRALQDTKGALKEKLRAFALSTVQYGRANEDVFHLLMREVNQPNSVFFAHRLKLVGQVIRKVWEQLAHLFQEEMRLGRMRTFDAMNLAALLDAMIRMYVVATHSSFRLLEPVAPETSVDMVLDVFFNGISEPKNKG